MLSEVTRAFQRSFAESAYPFPKLKALGETPVLFTEDCGGDRYTVSARPI
jgi:hypothetical protein